MDDKLLTVDEMLALKPCDPPYTREYLLKLWDGRERLTLAQILALDIPASHKVWAAVNVGGVNEAELLDSLRKQIPADSYLAPCVARCTRADDMAGFLWKHHRNERANEAAGVSAVMAITNSHVDRIGSQ